MPTPLLPEFIVSKCIKNNNEATCILESNINDYILSSVFLYNFNDVMIALERTIAPNTIKFNYIYT